MEERPRPGDNSGAYRSSLSVSFDGKDDDADFYAELRRRVGDEAVDQMLRTRELMRHPRPLADDERAALDATLTPVLADLRAAGAIVPEVRYEAHEDRGSDHVCAVIGAAGRSVGSLGVWVPLTRPAAGRVAALAEQVQEWEVEELAAAGRPATWPECPEHPASHPLAPVVAADGTATWRCPRSGTAIGAIGALGAADQRERRQAPGRR